ncbi:MAG: class I SAM-dependent methyltransferase, partial [Candidatus Latescibacteria bacterium]|nr:class I SAM-dependent methyltransferase [Candidatus Latescibacterota bacterium]
MTDLRDQYRTSVHLNARIDLHDRFSTNPYDFSLWIFDQMTFPSNCHALEVGCGTGKLWFANQDRLPPDIQITLSDFSIGMVSETRSRLKDQACNFAVCDAQNPPFSEGIFDVIVGNHMLYHMASPSGTIANLRRLLKPGGCLYAATNGEDHMQEIFSLIPTHMARRPIRTMTEKFPLETGAQLLKKQFSDVRLVKYQDSLEVTDAEPLAAYCLSLRNFSQAEHPLSGDSYEDLIDQINT